MDINTKTVARGALILFIGLIISKVLNYIFRAIMARFLGPGDYGLFSLALSIVSIFGWIALFGLNQAAERNIPYYNNSKGKVKGVIIAIFKIGIPVGLIITAISLLFSEKISLFLKKENLMLILQIMSFSIISYSLAEISLASIRGFKEIKIFTWIKYIIDPLLKIILTVIFLVLGLKITGVSLAYTITSYIILVLSFLILKTKIFNWTKIKSQINLNKKIFSFSWPLLFTGILFSAMQWTDTIILGYFKTEELIGIYNAAIPTAALIWIIQASFDSLFIPIMSELQQKNKREEMTRIFNSATRWIILLSLPITLILITFSEGILNALFGIAYIPGSLSLKIVAVGVFIGISVGPVESLLNVIGKTKIKMILRAIGLLINIILNIILIPIYGLAGAAIATALSIIVFEVLAYLYLKTKFKTKIFHIKYIYLAPILLVICYTLNRLYNPLNIINTILFILFLLILITITLLIVKIYNKEDIEIIKVIENKLKIKNYISNLLEKW